MRLSVVYLFIIACVVGNQISAQEIATNQTSSADSTLAKKQTKKAIYSKARKATIMSAALPGLGQIYNQKYWKAPVIYLALGGIAYWGITNHNEYKYYSNNLRAENDDDPNTLNQTRYSSDQLISQKNYYKKFRDMSIIFGSLVYALNIIDANVDAHLKTFDVSDDLSLQIKPYSNINYNNTLQTGLTVKLKFK